MRDGFTAFVGVNNFGKSSLLKFFYEFRSLFTQISQTSVVYDLLRGAINSYNPNGSDWAAAWNNTNNRDIEVIFRFPQIGAGSITDQFVYLLEVVITIPRRQNTYRVKWMLNTGHGDFGSTVFNYNGT